MSNNIRRRLEALPADPLLGLMMQFREDTRTDKIDLGVGVYRDESGNTPIMSAVRTAELRLAETGSTKSYESPRGNPLFCDHVASLLFGTTSHLPRLTNFATPGGCGALNIGLQLSRRLSPEAAVWISDPSWPNHAHVAQTLGFSLRRYRYMGTDGLLDFEHMMTDLESAAPGDVVIIQGPCHNPTGVDLTQPQWLDVADIVVRRELVPVVDIAYHGLGAGLDEDIAPVRTFLDRVPEAIISYSCSKNYGLYRERTGLLLYMAKTIADAANTESHIASLVRASYSMPPAHGAAIVATVLGDTKIRTDWERELSEMRDRLSNIRTALSGELVRLTGGARVASISTQTGMFSLLNLRPGAEKALAKTHGLYIPASGRINIAGLASVDVARAAGFLSDYILPE